MDTFITALTVGDTGVATDQLDATTIFQVFTDLVPFLVIIVPVALGIYFLRKLIKGSAKGKVRL